MSETLKAAKLHLFGEMEIDTSGDIHDLYAKSARIAEACGYVVCYEAIDNKPALVFYGEDCNDDYNLISVAYYENSKVTMIEKRLLKDQYPKNPKLIKTIPVWVRV